MDSAKINAGRVAHQGMEALLKEIAETSGDSRAGIFGPDSISWKINRESALFLGAGRAALLQLAHPWVATALAQHSSLLANPIARFHNTFRVVFTMIFGTRGQALQSSRQLYSLHAGIRGNLPEAVSGYSCGSAYAANEVPALRWVYATLVESALLAYECVLPPLIPSERQRYYKESKTMAALFGIPAESLPEDWAAFTEYTKAMVESDALGVNDLSRSMAHNILHGAGSRIKPPHWYRALTAFWLPERFQHEFRLDITPTGPRSAEQARRWLPRIYKTLPPVLRFVGPYREAQCRLAGRRLETTVSWSNRFWIGQPRLPPDE